MMKLTFRTTSLHLRTNKVGETDVDGMVAVIRMTKGYNWLEKVGATRSPLGAELARVSRSTRLDKAHVVVQTAPMTS